MVQRTRLSPLTPVTGPEGPSRSRDDLVSSGVQRAGSAQTSPVPGSSKLEEPQEAPWHASHQQQANDAPFGRSQSEVSLFAPSRRRSAVLTPGVATRSGQSDVPLSTKSSFRKSVPPPQKEHGRDLDESLAHRRLSMPPQSFVPTSPERVATPSEDEYQQIGGIKFGSLRITNATPTPTLRSELAPKMTAPGSSLGIAENSGPSGPEEPAAYGLATSTTDIKQPKPLSGAVSPVVAIFSDASTNGVDSSTSCSPFSYPSGGWKSDGVSPFSSMSQPSAQSAPEILGVNQKPDVKLPESTTTSGDKRKSAVGVARSDSGFGSSSSSEGPSLEPVSKADSGYGSSLSLRSLFGSKKAAKQAKSGAAPAPTSDEDREKRPGFNSRVPYKPPAKDASKEGSGRATESSGQPGTGKDETVTTRDPNDSVLRRSSLLGSFKARKSRESQVQQPSHYRGLSNPDASPRDVQAEKPSSSSGASISSHKPKKLQKLITTARRRSMPSMFPSQPQQHDVPSMPSDAAEKLEEHNRIFDEASKQPSFQVNVATKETPKAFVTVESKEVLDKPSARRTTTNIDRPRPKSTGPIPYHLGRSASVLSIKAPTQRKSILRRSRTAADMLNNSDGEDGVSDYILGYEVQVASIDSIRRSAGNSAFDAAFVPMAEDNVMETAMRRTGPRGPVPRASDAPRPYPRLRTRSSAPDFLETVSEPASPGSVDCYSQKKPKTPPPISIRTRGSKKKKRRRAPHSSSHGARYTEPQHPPLPGPRGYDERHGDSTTEQDLRRSLRSFPVPHAPSDMRPQRFGDPANPPEQSVRYNRRQSAGPFYPSPIPHSESEMGMGRYPRHPPPNGPYPSQVHGFHGPGKDDRHGSPYRMLHSYESPAYKGVPV